MLQAMNTGHDGGLTTIHANSPRDALYRLDMMVAMASLNIPERAVRQQTASAINLVIQVTRLSDGTRKVTSITEVTGMEGDMVAMQDIFRQDTSLRRGGKVCGHLATGIRPKCCERLASLGIHARDIFEHRKPWPGRGCSSLPDLVLCTTIILGLWGLSSSRKPPPRNFRRRRRRLPQISRRTIGEEGRRAAR
jgi:hypothetical protein